ncbi:PAS domain S-box protein [Leptolyngbya ohadii]|uniref:PAS domain S-box protein n=1 Tax=Leptolyngbya ohadii TaxID=1962290 RepID=UPI000B59E0D8|nr:PAS domain S-box protein [Leptolyngbya ohadii]
MIFFEHFLNSEGAVTSTVSAAFLTLCRAATSVQAYEIVFYIVIALSTWYGGLRSSIIVIVLSTLVIFYSLTKSINSVGISNVEAASFLLRFITVSIVIALINAQLKKNQRKNDLLNQSLLQESADRLKAALNAAQIGMWDWNIITGEIQWSPEQEQIFGLLPGQFDGQYTSFMNCLHPDDREAVNQAVAQALVSRLPYQCEYRVQWADDSIHWVEGRGQAFYNEAGKAVRMSGTVMLIDLRKQAQLLTQQQLEQQRLVMEVTQRIRQSLNLSDILQTTVDEVRQLLQTDRVIIFRFFEDWQGIVAVESCEADWTAILSTTLYDPCFSETYVEPFKQGLVTAKADIHTAEIKPCHLELLSQFQVRANLVVPIMQGGELWGLLIAHHCAAPRTWQDSEINLLRQIALQVGISLQQMNLVEQLQAELAQRQRVEAALQEKELLLRLFIQYAPAGIAMLDSEMRYLMASQQWVNEYQLDSIESLLNRSHYEVFPEIPETWRQIHRQCLAGAIERGDEDLFVRADGTLQWISWEIRPWYKPTDDIGSIIIFSFDVTQHKQAKDILQQSQNQIQRQLAEIETIYRNAPVGLAVLDTNLRFVRINERLAEMNGFSVEDHLGRTIRDLVPDLADTADQLLRPILETGEPRLNVEITGETPAQPGVRRTWLEHFLPLWDGNHIIGISAVCEEITERKQNEAALRQSEARLRLAQVASHSGVWDWDIQSNTVFWSPEYYQLYALDPSVAASYDNWLRHIHPDDRERVHQQTQRAVETGASDIRIEFRVIRSDTICWFADIGQIFYGNSGEPVRMIGIAIDITPQKQAELALQALNAELEQRVAERTAELVALNDRLLVAYQEQAQIQEALRESEERRRLALDLTHIGFWDYHLPSGKMVWNDNHFTLLGLVPGRCEASEKLWSNHVYPDDLDWVNQKLSDALNTQTDYAAEYRVIHADGSIRWMMARAKGMYDKAGQPLRLLGVLLDISDRKQAEAELEAQQAFLRQIIDTVPSSIFVKDKAGRFLVVNQASSDVHGSSPEAMLGKRELEFNSNLSQAQLEQFLASNRAVMENRQAQLHVQQIPTAQGDLRWYQTRICPWISPNNEVCGIIGNSVDITELKQVEAALQQKSQRLAAIIQAQQDITLNNASLDAVIAASLASVQALTDAAGVLIELLDGDQLVYRLARGVAPAYPGIRLQAENSLSSHCVAAGKILQCSDVATDPRVDFAACQQMGVQSIVAVPLLTSGGCVGVLNIFAQVPDAFSEVDIETLQLLAGFLATAIQLALEFEAKNTLLQALQESEDRYRSVVTVLAEGVVLQQADGQITACNTSAERILGLTQDQMMGHTSVDPQWQAIHEDGSPFPGETHPSMVTLRTGEPQSNVIMGVHKPNGDLTWISINTQPLFYPEQPLPYAVVASFIDITVQKQAELTLRHQAEREQMMTAIVQHIRDSLDLETILNTTVAEVRRFLQCDRVIVYRFNPDWGGVVVTESVAPGWQPILNWEIRDTYFVENREQAYVNRAIQATNDIYTAGLSHCHIELLEKLQVRAKLVVPIWQGSTLWGLLVVHQCNAPRPWQPLERDLLLQLSAQVAIAIQQSQLYRQVQQWNTQLEVQVQDRTAQLQQALDFEARLKRITDKVRDSLDERQILQAAVNELAQGLQVSACDAAIYNAQQTTSTIAYEYVETLNPAQGCTFEIAATPYSEIYANLLGGQSCHFCMTANAVRSEQQPMCALAVPLLDDQGVLGDLWLFKPPHESFDDQEVRLVRQVANQCAIALRQSRLYEAAQAQVQELERLNQLKDDFLSTVSHELRTPMSNIKMATQMLEISLSRLGVLADESTPVYRYFKVLREEGQREIGLINDLLDLTRLDGDTDPLDLTEIDLPLYLDHLAEPFSERMHQQEQHFVIQMANDLPPLITHLPHLQRILTELLHNACKYTPPGETITLSAQATSEWLQIQVSNSGVEISPEEYDLIFDKFYRIPNHDPWKHGGTGLGLALVKKMTQRLGGTIHLESGNGQTTFMLRFRASA